MQHVPSGVALCWGRCRPRLAPRAATARDAGRADERKRCSPTSGNRCFPDSHYIVGRCDVCVCLCSRHICPHLLGHAQFIRELHDKGTFKAMDWTDTRDTLHQLMDARMAAQHEVKLWSRRLPPASYKMKSHISAAMCVSSASRLKTIRFK